MFKLFEHLKILLTGKYFVFWQTISAGIILFLIYKFFTHEIFRLFVTNINSYYELTFSFISLKIDEGELFAFFTAIFIFVLVPVFVIFSYVKKFFVDNYQYHSSREILLDLLSLLISSPILIIALVVEFAKESFFIIGLCMVVMCIVIAPTIIIFEFLEGTILEQFIFEISSLWIVIGILLCWVLAKILKFI